MNKRSLLEEALRLCGLSESEALQLHVADNPRFSMDSISDEQLWTFLARYYQNMQIAADQIAMVTDIHEQQFEDILIDEQALAFSTGSVVRVHVMALLNAVALRELGLHAPRGGSRRSPA